MTPRLELRQSQTLVMTPRLQQALRMLRMSNLELAGHVAEIVEGNPLLATAPPTGGGPRPAAPGGTADGPDAIDLAASTVTLADHLKDQVRLARAVPAARAAALVLIDELDEDGYLRQPLAEVAARHGIPAETSVEALALVQAAEPAGVGARSLGECLRIQLGERGLLDSAMAVLIDGLDLLVAGRRDKLAERCGVGQAALGPMLDLLRTCNPRPGTAFDGGSAPVVVPDVFVNRSSTGWAVELNTETLPRVLVDNAYAARLGRGGGAVQHFITECSGQASWLIRSLEQRARTILAVATAIVTHQEPFFARGESGLRPLSQRALAQTLGLHDSTISRVTANKFLACDRGTFPLRHFFSQSIATLDGEAVAAAAVQARIRTLIGAELPPRTLSDDRIVTILRGEGIDIARRTVAKYRELMRIPSSVDRRRLSRTACG